MLGLKSYTSKKDGKPRHSLVVSLEGTVFDLAVPTDKPELVTLLEPLKETRGELYGEVRIYDGKPYFALLNFKPE